MIKRQYNRRKDVTTGSEQKFGIEHHTCKTIALPSSIDLRKSTNWVPAILDQGNIGSCVDNEFSNALKFCISKELNKQTDIQPSRLFLYWNARKSDNLPTNEDTGSSLLGCIKGIQVKGACSEINWPYDTSKYTICPPPPAFTDASTHIKNFQYLQVPQNLISIKQALVAGYPIVIGIDVYTSFESQDVSTTGNIKIPDTHNEKLLGGHCVALYGYNDTTQTFIMSNSWSDKWALGGYANIPYNYVLDPTLCDSIYQIRFFK